MKELKNIYNELENLYEKNCKEIEFIKRVKKELRHEISIEKKMEYNKRVKELYNENDKILAMLCAYHNNLYGIVAK